MSRPNPLLAAALTAIALPLAACSTLTAASTPAVPAQPPVVAAPGGASTTGPDSATAGGGPGQSVSSSGKEAAEKYAQCLRDHGLDVVALDGQILYSAGDGGPQQVSSSGESQQQSPTGQPGAQQGQGAPAPSPGTPEAECQQQVPEYRAIDRNQR